MSDQTPPSVSASKKVRRGAEQLVDDTLENMIEELGFTHYQLSKKDRGWLTPEVAGEIQEKLNELGQRLHSLSETVGLYQPAKTLNFAVGGEMPGKPSGLFEAAMRDEEKTASTD